MKAADNLRLELVEPKSKDTFDPYESFPNLRTDKGMKRHQDLRKLSEWIRAKRAAARNSRDV